MLGGEGSGYLAKEIGILLPKNQRQHRTLHIQKDALPHPEGCAAPRIVLVTVPRVSRSCEHVPDGFDLHLLPREENCPLSHRPWGHQPLSGLRGFRWGRIPGCYVTTFLPQRA